MKVYIVTRGCYSDYSIDKVFTDREKAEKYVAYNSGGYDEPMIEEYDTVEQDFEQINYIEVNYDITKDDEFFEIEFFKTDSIGKELKSVETTDFSVNRFEDDYDSLFLTRTISAEHIKENIKDKYLKVCRDLYAQIKSLKEVEGWNEEMINDWLTKNQTK